MMIQKTISKKMNPKIKRQLNFLKQDKLTDRERSLMRVRLSAHIYITHRAHHKKAALLSPFFNFFEISASILTKSAHETYVFTKQRVIPFAMVLILVFLSAGTSFAAESSLPGETLYPVKININEGVIDFLSFSPKSKADWAVRAIERRLEEAAQLSVDGRLNDSTRQVVEDGIAAKTTELRAQVSVLASTNQVLAAEEVETSLESSLKAHEIVLNKISKKITKTKGIKNATHIDALITSVKTDIASTTAAKVDIQEKIVAQDQYDGNALIIQKLADVQSGLAEVTSDTTVSSSALSSSTLALIQDNIKSIKAIISDTNTALAPTIPIKQDAKKDLTNNLGHASQLISDIKGLISVENNAPLEIRDIINGGGAVSATSTAPAPLTILRPIEGNPGGSSSTTDSDVLDAFASSTDPSKN